MGVLWRDPTGRVTLEEHEDGLSSVTVIYKANDTRDAGTVTYYRDRATAILEARRKAAELHSIEQIDAVAG